MYLIPDIRSSLRLREVKSHTGGLIHIRCWYHTGIGAPPINMSVCSRSLIPVPSHMSTAIYHVTFTNPSLSCDSQMLTWDASYRLPFCSRYLGC